MNSIIRDGALLRCLRSLEATCDVTIICQHNVRLAAHRVVLAMGSALLQGIITDSHSCQNMTIFLPQVSSRLVSLVLDFVYNGSIAVTNKTDYNDFLDVAKMLKLHNIDIKSDTSENIISHNEYKTDQTSELYIKDNSEFKDCPTDIKDLKKDTENEEESATSVMAQSRKVPELVPLIRVRRRAKEVRNKVLPSPWKSRSPRHCMEWSYSLNRSRCHLDFGMNDSNNNLASTGKDIGDSNRDIKQRLRSNIAKPYDDYSNVNNNNLDNNDSDLNHTTRNAEQPTNCTATSTGTSRCDSSYVTDIKHASTKPSLLSLSQSQSSETTDSCTAVDLVANASDRTANSGFIPTAEPESDPVKTGKDEDRRAKVYTCKECGKTFTQLRNYKYHRSIHDGSGEFAAKCTECGKTFNDRGYLRSHMKIHKDKKEYACNFCPKRFNQRVAYNMHLRIHTGVKPHECATCGKSFSRKMLLKQHERVHTGEKPFVCPECGKSFADRSNMMLHARLHTGEKPYTCNICNKSFTKKHHLKTHINFHTGIKPYACKKCGVTFSQSSNMKTHFKKCNGKQKNQS